MKQHLTLGELIHRSAERLLEAEERMRKAVKRSDPFLERFLLKETSILARLSIRYWLRLRIGKIKSKLTRK
jgi:hypothetical protein